MRLHCDRTCTEALWKPRLTGPVLAAGEPVEVKKEETVSSTFVMDLEAAVKLFVEKWQEHPEGANTLAQKHEGELVRQELRPLVFEEVRLQVDDEMRILLQNLKVCPFTNYPVQY